MVPTRFWSDMGWPDFQAADMARVIAVLPVAAIEQHGPHLPVGVDAVINEGYVARAARALPDDLPVLFLPLQTVGVSGEHSEYPGTLTLSTETAIRAWTEIGDSVARTGCRKLIVMSSHGGNGSAIEAVALSLRMRWGMLAIHASWRRLGYPENLFSAREIAHGVHGGDAETSLMLAFRPEDRAHGEGARLRQRVRVHRAGLRAPAREAAARLRAGWRATSTRRAPSAKRKRPPRRRARRRATHGVERFHRAPARRPRLRRLPPRLRPSGTPNMSAHFDFEREAFAEGRRWVAGVDEVGRGPLAGPVGVAAVILDPADLPEGLDDSKVLNAAKRDELRPIILAKALAVSIVFASATRDRRVQYSGRGAARDGARRPCA